MDSFVEIIIFLAIAVFTAVKFFADKKKHGNNAEKKEKKTAEKTSPVAQITLTLEDLREIKDMIGQGMSLQQAKEKLFARKEHDRAEAEAKARVQQGQILRSDSVVEEKEASVKATPINVVEASREATTVKISSVNVVETSREATTVKGEGEARWRRQQSSDVSQAFSDAESLRRAFVVQEILKKPIALRSESEREYYAESM